MSRYRLALSTLLLAVCGLAGAAESSSRDADYRYSDIFMVHLDGSGRDNLTRSYAGLDDNPALSPNDRTLVFERGRIEGGYMRTSLAVMPSRGGPRARAAPHPER